MSNQKWKKIVETKVLPSIRSNRIIQKSDGKFFEKFGSLLKDLQERQKISNKDYGNKAIQSIVDPPTATSPIEMITTAVGWSINEPYSELLSEILHIVGTDVRVQPESLLEFLQEVFLVNWEYHSRMLEKVKKKVAPSIVLNVNVIEGKELPAKDINGSSDPFCVLYMSSSPQEQHKTEVQEETLSPKWQEHFSLPVQDPQEDTLHIEVYDFDPAESMLEKVNQIGKVKGIKGMKNFFRELTRKTPKGQEYIYELIGSIAIPLKSIPPNGETCWAKIQNDTKATSKGQIRLAMAFGSEKNREMGIQEYRQLIKALVQYYLEKDQIEPYKWRGDFGLLAQTLMRQHVVQSNLTTTDKSLAEFVEFVSVHVNNQPLSFTVFTALLDTFVDTYTTFDENQMKSFWEFAERLLSSCLNIVKKLRQLNPTDEHAQTQLIGILSILSSLSQTADVNPLTDVGLQKDVHSMLKDVVSEGARDWFASIMDQNRPESQEDEAVLVNRVQIVLLVTTDLQIANEHHAKLFDEALKFPYAATLFEVYYPGLVELCQPLVERMSSKLETIRIPFIDTNEENQTNSYGDYSTAISTGTSLLELYLSLRNFFELGQCNKQIEFYDWFSRVVVNWLDIARYKALQRIDKAIELDTLSPVDSSVKYSSSALDTVGIFYTVKEFWEQIEWPDVEACCAYVSKIIEDICKSCTHFADKMSKKIDALQSTTRTNEFEVTPQWCYAINNIDYVRHSIEPLVQKLGVFKIANKLVEASDIVLGERFERTVKEMVDNANELLAAKQRDLIFNAINKMLPVIQKLLLEFEKDNSLHKLMTYLDDSLITMKEQLSSENFDRVLATIWKSVLSKMENITESSLNQKKPHQFFKGLLETFDVFVDYFNESSDANDEFRSSLELYSLSTDELIHRYHVQQCRRGQGQSNEDINGDCGQLTIRAMILKTKGLLKIEMMNCRSLKPVRSNGICNPCVKINFLPADQFLKTSKPKTQAQKNNLFPLFDETLEIVLTNDQLSMTDALIQFEVIDHYFLCINKFVAECFFLLNKVKLVDDPEEDMMNMPQIQLKLGKPSSEHDPKIWNVIEQRSLSWTDKKANEFIKRQKARMNRTNCQEA